MLKYDRQVDESGTSARAWDISFATSESDKTVPAAMCDTRGAMTFREMPAHHIGINA